MTRPWQFNEGSLQCVAVAVLACVSLSGCAFGLYGLASQGTKAAVFFDSEPKEATIEVEGQRCQTPCSMRLSRRHEYTVVASHPGYRTQSGYITKEVDALVLYLDGILLPHILGTVNDLRPDHLFFTLTKEE